MTPEAPDPSETPTREATRALEAYADAGGDATTPGVARALAALAEQAPGLLPLALGDPTLLPDVLASGLEHAPSEHDATGRLLALASEVGDGEALNAALRRFRHRGVVRIALREVEGLADVGQTSAEMADLASDCIEGALRGARAWALERHGRVLDATGAEVPFVVLGMGKLGGRELNVGSDIDICFFYGTDEAEVEGGDLSPHQLFAKVAARTARALGDITEDGFCFRVDLRLRPEGSQGALANSLASAERYYEVFGRTWERAAMLRARPVAGDVALGEELLGALAPFVYRRSVDPHVAQEMSEMLLRSRQELGDIDDVKLGPGGIREAEWVVQTLQLIWGGQHAELRVPGTALAIRRLAATGLLPGGAAETLEADWVFLRALEHRIQVRAGYATHALPKQAAELEALAHSLGQPDARTLRVCLDETCARVSQLFAEVCGAPADASRSAFDELADAIAEGESEELVAPRVRRLFGVEDGTEATVHLRRLGMRADAPLGPAGRREAPELGGMLLSEVARAPDPVLALRHLADFFQRAGDIGHVRLLSREPRQTRRLVGLFGTSATLSAALVGHPEALDLLLASDGAPDAAEIAQVHHALSWTANQDAEHDFVPALRRLARETSLRIGLSDAAGELSREERHELLGALADAQIRAAFDYAAAEAYARFGRPMDPTVGPRMEERYAGLLAVALGRLGAGEMAFGSDLDLIFLYGADGVCPETGRDHGEVFTRVARRCLALLSIPDAEGRGWTTDSRLRPDGSRGTLVVSLSAFEHYHATQARSWERQALLRARPVAGEPRLMRPLARRLAQMAVAQGSPDAHELALLRARLELELGREQEQSWNPKFGYGARLDAELLLQALYMGLGEAPAPKGLLPISRSEMLSALRKAGVLGRTEVNGLRTAMEFFDDVQEAIRLLDERLPENLNPLGHVGLRVARRLDLRARDGVEPEEVLAETWKMHASFTRVLFESRLAAVGTRAPWAGTAR